MSIFSRLSQTSRQRKLALFYETFLPLDGKKVLDVGGEAGRSDGTLQLIDSYPFKKNLSVLNISAEHIERIKQTWPEVDSHVGDALDLPWPDKFFDIVYCNAVIEHVGDFDCQKKMAQEIQRVSKSWFVTTPNRWYPFEFHMRLPFVPWLPFHGYLFTGRFISYNHIKRKYAFGINHKHLRLLTARELEKCFPGSQIVKQRVTFMPEILIAIGGDPKKP